MSRIDELIHQFCPNGVAFERLGDVADFRYGFTASAQESGDYRFIRITDINQRGELWPDGAKYVGASDGALDYVVKPGDLLMARTGATYGKTMLVTSDEPAVYASFLIRIRFTKPVMLPAYYWHFAQSSLYWDQANALVGTGGQPQFNANVLKLVKVPVPPIEVQREIVRVLDLFQALRAKLEGELEARRRQYAFYWRALLLPRDSWRRTTLGKIATVFDGPHATPKKTNSGPWYLSISSLMNGRFDLAESAHIGEDQYDTWIRRVAPRLGDTMFSYETRLGQAAYWDRDEPAALGRRMGLLRPSESEICPKFLTLAYLGPEFQALIRAKTVRGATVDRIPIADMASWPISIPSISEQQRIVGILDKFDAFVNDPGIGLPAEINARRKQYEYYRGRLLTFKEVAA